MEKDHRFELRLTGKEHRAVKRMAKSQGQSVAELIRVRVVNAALSFDPKQVELPLVEKGERMRASG